jgi:hypothetical protein
MMIIRQWSIIQINIKRQKINMLIHQYFISNPIYPYLLPRSTNYVTKRAIPAPSTDPKITGRRPSVDL